MEGKLTNPAPIGLTAFGMTTILLNLHNAELIGLGSVILAIGIFYGGLAQVMVGAMEWKNGNLFGTVAFTSYGFFWVTLVFIVLMPNFGWGLTAAAPHELASFLLLWGLFTLALFIGTLKSNRMLQFVFLTLTLLFFMLAINDFGLANIKVIAGYVGIICGASAMYLAAAEVLNEMFGRTVLPIGAPK